MVNAPLQQEEKNAHQSGVLLFMQLTCISLGYLPTVPSLSSKFIVMKLPSVAA